MAYLPPNHVSAPSVPKHLLKRVKEIDPGFEVRFYVYQPNPITLQPFVKEDGEPVLRPRWYAFSRGDNGKFYLLFVHETPKKEFAPFNEILIKRLEAGSLRNRNVKEVVAQEEQAEDALKEKRVQEVKDLQRDVIRANKSKIQKVMEKPDAPIELREKDRITSFRSQTNRSRETELVDDSADYEKPDYSTLD